MYLILSRKKSELIYIGEEIKIKITEISKNNVKLGISAPKNFKIRRGELKK